MPETLLLYFFQQDLFFPPVLQQQYSQKKFQKIQTTTKKGEEVSHHFTPKENCLLYILVLWSSPFGICTNLFISLHVKNWIIQWVLFLDLFVWLLLAMQQFIKSYYQALRLFLYYEQWCREHADTCIFVLTSSSYKMNYRVKTYTHLKACVTQEVPEGGIDSAPTV